MLKLAILVRMDLKMSKGKIAAQVAHAARAASVGECSVVVLKVKDGEELAKYAGLVITDAGKTEVPPGTITCGWIGPAHEDIINEKIKNLKLL